MKDIEDLSNFTFTFTVDYWDNISFEKQETRKRKIGKILINLKSE